MKRFTLILYSFLIVCMIFLALPAWLKNRQEHNDARALERLIEVRDNIYALTKESGSVPSIQIFNLQEASQLPEPFSMIPIDPDIVVHYIVHLKRDRGTIMLLSLSHRSGAFEHRWIDIYGARRQQKIMREL